MKDRRKVRLCGCVVMHIEGIKYVGGEVTDVGVAFADGLKDTGKRRQRNVDGLGLGEGLPRHAGLFHALAAGEIDEVELAVECQALRDVCRGQVEGEDRVRP